MNPNSSELISDVDFLIYFTENRVIPFELPINIRVQYIELSELKQRVITAIVNAGGDRNVAGLHFALVLSHLRQYRVMPAIRDAL